MAKLGKEEARKRRHLRIRRKVVGTPDRPRLNVFRSSRHIYAQIIDDVSGRTLVSASSLDPELKLGSGGNVSAARSVGELLGKRAVARGVTKVVFDRGGYLYHGRVKALAEAARESGLEF
ncbi:MAG TPA: 50S ribosomal protein L18 [Clostridiales bacterium]|nr:50S ribosomal protein L18 [Clostridiales bacterium]